MAKIEVVIDSIRVSLLNYQRVVILKEKDGGRDLSIWIDITQADAIATGLQKANFLELLTLDFRRTNQAKILVVDDEAILLELISCLLTDEGYEVDTAADGIDALAKIKRNRYSLLLTGIRMPYMTGFELYEHIQKIVPSLADKTIVVSGSVEDADTRDFLTKNKLPYVAKPFNAKHIEERGKAGTGRYQLEYEAKLEEPES